MEVSWFGRHVETTHLFHVFAVAAAAVVLRHVPSIVNVQLWHFPFLFLVFDIVHSLLRLVDVAFDPHYDPVQRCVDLDEIDPDFDVDRIVDFDCTTSVV